MRVLVVATDYPWPVTSGARSRLSAALGALATCGPVDLVCAVPAGRTDLEPPPAGLLDSHCVVRLPAPRPVTTMARAAVRARRPLTAPLSGRHLVEQALRRHGADGHDLVWCFQVRSWLLAERAVPAGVPVVVDLDDLEDQKIAARLAVAARPAAATAARSAAARSAAARWLAAEDRRRWARLHRQIDARSAATVVCSTLDAGRSGLRGVRVVPNTVPLPALGDPAGADRAATEPSADPGTPAPTVLLHGTMRYPPNADAAAFLVADVLPRLRRLVPEARARLVGVASPAVQALHDPPMVTVTGPVPDMGAELREAAVVVAPVRYGSGTRIKVLEALAHARPVVSTTLGCEGIAARHDEHLLVADGAGALADACARILTDPALAARLGDAGRQLVASRYHPGVAADAVRAVVTDALTGSGTPGGSAGPGRPGAASGAAATGAAP